MKDKRTNTTWPLHLLTKWLQAQVQNHALPQTVVISRRPSLEGRVNIYVAPQDQNTQVSVNIRYALTIKVEGTYTTENRYGTPIQTGTVPAQTSAATFNTNQPTTVAWGTPHNQWKLPVNLSEGLKKGILQLAL